MIEQEGIEQVADGHGDDQTSGKMCFEWACEMLRQHELPQEQVQQQRQSDLHGDQQVLVVRILRQ